ncbi:hypothetical protein Sgleb_62640 [Streptomyces glebosus]|uniref:Uncharacterized protein n=1 Tax=Streptomyces glebosus TaxID=249580 RepID=A0A640T384_9ACTN|nr:hypothetical protein Sgleb_62640 [Streptomyces glebosus]GHG45312.1 hypothetical protein GCM10010513_00390 [Streptomyces glebosus]
MGGLQEDDLTVSRVLLWVERRRPGPGDIPEGGPSDGPSRALLRVTSLTPATPPHTVVPPSHRTRPAAPSRTPAVSPASVTNPARSRYIPPIPLPQRIIGIARGIPGRPPGRSAHAPRGPQVAPVNPPADACAASQHSEPSIRKLCHVRRLAAEGAPHRR